MSTDLGSASAPPRADGAAPRARRRFTLSPTVTVFVALGLLVVLGEIVVRANGEELLDQGGLVTILQRSTALGLVAIGQTLVILAGKLDLSVGYLIGLCSLVAAQMMDGSPGRILPAIVVTLAVAVAVGLANGLVVTRLKVHAFIATLSMGLILRGVLEQNYNGPAGDVPRVFQHLGYDRIGPLPVSTVLMLVLGAVAWWLLRRTRLGYHLYAVGGDTEVARQSGIRDGRVVVWAHVLCSVFAGLAGLYMASRLGSGAPWVGTEGGYDLESIAAVVLGGTVLAGGRGGVVGTIGAVLLLAVLDTIFDDLGVNSFFKDVVRGGVLILAVALYARRYAGVKTV